MINFGRRSPKDHLCQVIFKSGQNMCHEDFKVVFFTDGRRRKFVCKLPRPLSTFNVQNSKLYESAVCISGYAG